MNIKDKIQSLWWYHCIDLGNGIITPGRMPHDKDAYRLPDLAGKRVLDVGAWDGYWTFEALKRGASQVVAVENWSDYPFLAGDKPVKEWQNFDLCREILGYTDEQCQRYTMSLYDVKPETFGMFDVVFLFGTLYHMRHPLLALDIVSAVCKSTICIETAICDDYSAYKGFGAGYANRKDIIMEFFPTDEFDGISSNWWSPTLECLDRMISCAGFDDVDVWKFIDPPNLSFCRGFAKGTKLTKGIK
jgi:tRNA (mo5U34)-methyltransferase